MKKSIHQDVYIGIVCLLLCAAIFFMNFGLGGGAGTMPLLLDAILAVLSVLILLHGIRKSKLGDDQQGKKYLTVDALKIPIITWGFVVLYVVLFYLVGFYIATAILLPGLMLFMKQRNWLVIVIIDVVFLLCIYFVFDRTLGVAIDGFGMLSYLV